MTEPSKLFLSIFLAFIVFSHTTSAQCESDQYPGSFSLKTGTVVTDEDIYLVRNVKLFTRNDVEYRFGANQVFDGRPSYITLEYITDSNPNDRVKGSFALPNEECFSGVVRYTIGLIEGGGGPVPTAGNFEFNISYCQPVIPAPLEIELLTPNNPFCTASFQARVKSDLGGYRSQCGDLVV